MCFKPLTLYPPLLPTLACLLACVCSVCVTDWLGMRGLHESSSPRAASEIRSEISGLNTPGTPNPGPWQRAPSSVGSRFSVRRFMTGSRMGSFKRASGMEDDDQDSNLFFDRVYCANPQVCTSSSNATAADDKPQIFISLGGIVAMLLCTVGAVAPLSPPHPSLTPSFLSICRVCVCFFACLFWVLC